MPKDELDIRWKQRFENYRKALGLLHKACDQGSYTILEEQGLIQCFEYTFELAWNTLKDFLEDQGYKELRGARDVIRTANEVALISDGVAWMNVLLNRNKTSHTYNEKIAREVRDFIRSDALRLFLDLEDILLKEKAE